MTHRDLKQENILIHNNQYKIADFGFSNDKKLMQTMLGTPLYMAPEIIEGKKYDNKVDIWSLGVILYNLITKDFPFYDFQKKGLYSKIVHKKFTLKRKYKKKFNENLKNLFNDCFEKDPQKRLSIDMFLDHPVFEEIKSQYDQINKKIHESIRVNGKHD